jgi:threonyl-tRNA synthetase
MNCPFHVAIYRSQLRSYRELPVRYAELGTVYRYERSGVLHGLMRVRGFTQDDAHLFITEDQIEAELAACVRFGMDVLRMFGFEEVKFFMATRPKDFMGEIEAWNRAEAAIRRVLESTGMPFEVDEGGGAFYGPKIDLKIRDALGREWQCTTFQLDYQMPERFELEYVAADGSRQRPIMIHRALLGSIERFIAVLIEHFAGAFPIWLAPVQARVITVSEKAEAYGREVEGVLLAAGLRADADLSADKLNAKIRNAQLEKIPYMLVVGERDMAARVVSPRTRDGKQLPAQPIDDLAKTLVAEAAVPSLGVPNSKPA